MNTTSLSFSIPEVIKGQTKLVGKAGFGVAHGLPVENPCFKYHKDLDKIHLGFGQKKRKSVLQPDKNFQVCFFFNFFF